MGPSSTRRRTRSSRTTTTTTTTTTTIQKKKMKQPLMKKNKEEKSADIVNAPCKSPCKEDSLKRSSNEMELENNICSTPKAERFRIPEIKTCPPAPKKRRIISSPSSSSNCHSLRRSPITFFAPSDLDLFFFLALGDIPV